MSGQDLRTDLCPQRRRVPLETRQCIPHRFVGAVIRLQPSQQAATTSFSQCKSRGTRRTVSLRMSRVQDNRVELFQFTGLQRILEPSKARQKHESTGLTANQLPKIDAILRCQLLATNPNVTQKHDVVFEQFFLCGKLIQISSPTAHTFQIGMIKQTTDLDAGITLQCISQIAIFPSRIRLHDKNFELLVTNADRDRQLVVVRQSF